MSKKAKPENTAVPRLVLADKKPVTLIDTTTKVASVVKAHPNYAAHPEVQTSLTKWVSSAALIGGYEQQISALRAQLSTLEGARDGAIVEWGRDKRTLLSAIEGASGGSAQEIAAWGFGVASRNPSEPSTDAPLGLRVGYTRAHAFVIRWKAVRGSRGYLLQIGDGTPSGWGSILQATRATYVPAGIASGQNIAIRVAVIRKNGQSGWSDALHAVYR